MPLIDGPEKGVQVLDGIRVDMATIYARSRSIFKNRMDAFSLLVEAIHI